MNQTSKILHKLAKTSDGKMRIVKVPPEKRPTAESLKKLDTEIRSALNTNRAMEYKSYIKASKQV